MQVPAAGTSVTIKQDVVLRWLGSHMLGVALTLACIKSHARAFVPGRDMGTDQSGIGEASNRLDGWQNALQGLLGLLEVMAGLHPQPERAQALLQWSLYHRA